LSIHYKILHRQDFHGHILGTSFLIPRVTTKSPHQDNLFHPNEGLILTLDSCAFPQPRRLEATKYRILHCDTP
jgi:hypothetical protein